MQFYAEPSAFIGGDLTQAKLLLTFLAGIFIVLFFTREKTNE